MAAEIRKNEAFALFLSSSASPSPNLREKSVPLPSERPRRTDVRKVMSVNEDPTAASTSGPRARPTMRVSATL